MQFSPTISNKLERVTCWQEHEANLVLSGIKGSKSTREDATDSALQMGGTHTRPNPFPVKTTGKNMLSKVSARCVSQLWTTRIFLNEDLSRSPLWGTGSSNTAKAGVALAVEVVLVEVEVVVAVVVVMVALAEVVAVVVIVVEVVAVVVA